MFYNVINNVNISSDIKAEYNRKAAIDKKGLPIGGQSFIYARLRCKKCGAEYDAEKKGMYYAIKPTLPQIQQIFKEFNPFYNN